MPRLVLRNEKHLDERDYQEGRRIRDY